MNKRVYLVVYHDQELDTETKEFESYIEAKLFAQNRALDGFTNVVVAEVIDRAVCRKAVEWEKP